MLRKTEGKRRRGRQRRRWLDGNTDSTNMGLSKLWEIVKDREAWRAPVPGVETGHDLATEQQHKQDSEKVSKLPRVFLAAFALS